MLTHFTAPEPLSFTAFPFVSEGLKRRNTMADWAFYDVSNLTDEEFSQLVVETNVEGSILLVEPRAADGSSRIRKFNDFAGFRAEPGDLLQNFCIAGVGSSDLGAASLARTLANHLDAPVGAIVAGYGVSDLLSEALGGWFFFGAANRKRARLAGDAETPMSSAATAASWSSGDTQTLFRLLCEPEREIRWLLGHSKGCLSIAFVLHALAQQDPAAFARIQDATVVTTGAVVTPPDGMRNLHQFLGSLDWFGGMNSSSNQDHVKVPGAWHHLNTDLGFAMDLAPLLDGIE